jgi:hypothetical protein
MNLNAGGDEDMTEVQGSGDALDESAGVKDEDDDKTLVNSVDSSDGKGLMKVLQAFEELKKEFDEKFKKIWS